MILKRSEWASSTGIYGGACLTEGVLRIFGSGRGRRFFSVNYNRGVDMVIRHMPVGTLKGARLFALTEPFRFYSMVLGTKVIIPTGFICDFESIPLIRGLCRTGGLIHDYLCRYDSKPISTKRQAADIYREALQYFGHPAWKIGIKYWAVRMAWGYFHKKRVLGT